MAPKAEFYIKCYQCLSGLNKQQCQSIHDELGVASKLVTELKLDLLRGLPQTFHILIAAIKDDRVKISLVEQLTYLGGDILLSNEPPKEYLCPIGLTVIPDPIAIELTKGVFIHFSKNNLLDWLKVQPINPISRKPLTPHEVERKKIDIKFQQQITQWVQKNVQKNNEQVNTPESYEHSHKEKNLMEKNVQTASWLPAAPPRGWLNKICVIS